MLSSPTMIANGNFICHLDTSWAIYIQSKLRCSFPIAYVLYRGLQPLLLCSGLSKCSHEHVRSKHLATALSNLTKAIADVETLVAEMQAHRDPLASHICAARRAYRNLQDTKSGKRHANSARLRWQRACELGFRGTLTDWERLIAAGE